MGFKEFVLYTEHKMLFSRKNVVIFIVTLLCVFLLSTNLIKAQNSTREYKQSYNLDIGSYNARPLLFDGLFFRHYLDNKLIGTTRLFSNKYIKDYIEPGVYRYKVIVTDIFGFEATIYKEKIYINDNKIFRVRCVHKWSNKCTSSYVPRVEKKRNVSDVSKYNTNIKFNENLSIKSVTIEEVTVDPGITKTYKRDLSHSYDVNVAENFRNALGLNLGLEIASKLIQKAIGRVEHAASKQYGYNFGQQKTEGVSITLDGSKCNKYQIEKITKLRTGKVILSSKSEKEYEFDFNIIDELDINAKNLCLP